MEFLLNKVLQSPIEIEEDQLKNVVIRTKEGSFSLDDYLVYKIVKVVEVMTKDE